ncbi:MAG: hypothetical protein FWG57_09205 [Endomicrobia bacterium]|nr:hypothetical protein [Endomicrobiia bacterium]
MQDINAGKEKTEDLLDLQVEIEEKGLKSSGLTIQFILAAVAGLVWRLLQLKKDTKINIFDVGDFGIALLAIIAVFASITMLIADIRNRFGRKNTEYNAVVFMHSPEIYIAYIILFTYLTYMAIQINIFAAPVAILSGVFYLWCFISSFIDTACISDFKYKYYKNIRRWFVIVFLITTISLIVSSREIICRQISSTKILEGLLISAVILFLLHFLFITLTKRKISSNILELKKLFKLGHVTPEEIEIKLNILVSVKDNKYLTDYVTLQDNTIVYYKGQGLPRELSDYETEYTEEWSNIKKRVNTDRGAVAKEFESKLFAEERHIKDIYDALRSRLKTLIAMSKEMRNSSISSYFDYKMKDRVESVLTEVKNKTIKFGKTFKYLSGIRKNLTGYQYSEGLHISTLKKIHNTQI